MIVAHNAILLFVALSLEANYAVPIMMHSWYSTLLPRIMVETLGGVVLGPIAQVCEKIKDKPPTSLRAKTFSFGRRPHATLFMLFLNAVGEVYEQHDRNGQQRFQESRRLMQQFIPLTPRNIMSMMVGDVMSSPEIIRISSCYTMFGDLEKAFGVYMEETQMYRFMQKHGMKTKGKHSIVEPWPLRITEGTTKEEFAIRCATSYTGCERYMESERL